MTLDIHHERRGSSMANPTQIVFPVIFFIVLFVLAGLIAPFLLRLFRISIPAKLMGLIWSILGDALILIISLLVVTAYHLMTMGYIIAFVIFVVISTCIAIFFYFSLIRKHRE